MIGITVLIRGAVRSMESRSKEDPSSGLRFSLDRGEVWASWHGAGRPLRLGAQRIVSEKMEDFLAHKSGDDAP